MLFADIVGSTAMGAAHDPEVVRETLARAFAALSEILRTHGGTVEKFIGDAIMAVFGVPAAHDDDADRAVRAAFGCRERITDLNRQAQLALEVRIGVNTGQAVAGTGEGEHFLVTGTPVNVAARIQQAAAPGEILVGPMTRQLTSGGVAYGDARAIEAKGLGRIETWPAERLASAVPEQRRGIAGLHAPLIGRDRELRLLHDAFARVADGRTPSLITIYGPAGAGKSRLTSEFAEHIGAPRVRGGRCLPYGEGITLYPVQQILRVDLGIEHTDAHAEATVKLRAAVAATFGEDPDREPVVARLLTITGLAQAGDVVPQVAPEDLAEELRWGVRRYFERRAARDPLVLVFEDVHWAEPALLDLVEHLAEWSRAPLLVVCLARPDFRELRPSWGANAANAVSITLAPLPPEDTRRLIAELLAIDALSETVRAEVVTRAEGNPLYVEEFLRMLMEAGRIEHRAGRWVATSDLSGLEVPPTLQGLITARLDRVDPEVKALLQRASLVGRLFSTSGLSAIGGEEPRPEQLRDAVRRDLLIEADERAPGEGRVYRFKHVLIRDVTYATIPKGQRARMHDNYARWLEATFGDRREEFGDLIAHHAEQAFLLANELGRAEAPLLGQRALDLLLGAATRARPRQDGTARRLYERAAAVADAFPASPAQRAEAHGFAAVQRYMLASDPGRLDAALALCEAAGPSEALVRILSAVALRDSDMDKRDIAIALWDRAVEVARALGDAEFLAGALTDRAFGFYLVGDMDRFARQIADALAYMRASGAKRNLVWCLSRCIARAVYSGDFTTARSYLEEAETELPKERSRMMEAGRALGWSHYSFEAGDLREAVSAGELALAAAREAGVPHRIAMGTWRMGEALLAAGDPEQARALLAEGAAILEGLGNRGQLPEVSARCARACVRLGDLAAGRRYIEIAERAVIKTDVESLMVIGVAHAELATAEGDAIAADAAFRETLALVAPSPFAGRLAQTRVAYAEFLIREGRFADAREQLRVARDFYRDPLAQRRREAIDALLARCEVGV